MLLRLFVRLYALRSKEEGQTTAEYALVILAAAAVAVVLITWARSTGKLPALADIPFTPTREGARPARTVRRTAARRAPRH
jgi:Flp pilus assembly pilin Flp